MNQMTLGYMPGVLNFTESGMNVRACLKHAPDQCAVKRQFTGRKQEMNQSTGKRTPKEQGTKKEKRKQLCPVYKKCGGCQLLDMEYKRQLDWKKEQISKLLKPFGKLEGITGMEDPAHYRHKVHAVFGRDARGNAISGVYKEGTHIIVPVDTCLLENEKADAIIKTIRGLLKSFKIKIYQRRMVQK